MATFTIYTDNSGEWRWRLTATNGRQIADSGEGYRDRGDCEAAIEIVKREAPSAPVQDE